MRLVTGTFLRKTGQSKAKLIKGSLTLVTAQAILRTSRKSLGLGNLPDKWRIQAVSLEVGWKRLGWKFTKSFGVGTWVAPVAQALAMMISSNLVPQLVHHLVSYRDAPLLHRLDYVTVLFTAYSYTTFLKLCSYLLACPPLSHWSSSRLIELALPFEKSPIDASSNPVELIISFASSRTSSPPIFS
ncbi:hypothetical protein HYPSUDRAFT_288515 [Hypholoma sublateritium FD-334 SS-4]|uniref:Uncharacterized protein n=1 Tax=Hypholoma sublateritium (strain FD-334 SS-4) TaxID=945553 RepID=A0A0D2P8I2_HYPSF|nr:hypothetical protein HYPSUDRAFT_288515 [Hypholoma sublateritium FD-334 SS-4]